MCATIQVEGGGNRRGCTGVAEAPRGLIGSPSVPGREQMSEWDERARSRFLLHLYFCCFGLFVCLALQLAVSTCVRWPRIRCSGSVKNIPRTDAGPEGWGAWGFDCLAIWREVTGDRFTS